jgi:Fe-S-cluster containining protein
MGKQLTSEAQTIETAKPRLTYDCSKCPAYCCAIYERVQVTPRDVNRLARHFGITFEQANQRFTKMYGKERVLRRKYDPIFGQACGFLNKETRQCTIYHARPSVCREFPVTTRCAYYDLLRFERRQQDDVDALPLVKITFRNGNK